MIKILKQVGFSILALLAGKAAQSQIWIEQTGADDPFEGVTFEGQVYPASADVDGDGDIDIVGGICGEPWLSFFENEGNNSFNNVQGIQNPFENIDDCTNPEFVDLDGDGDLDLVIGVYSAYKYSVLKLYWNNNGIFEEELDNNPFEGITAYYDAHPAFSDIDSDGDVDLLVGSYNGLSMYLNDGMNNFESTALTATTFIDMDGEGYVTPAFADIDMDGDEDAIFGNKYGDLKYFENVDNEFIQRTDSLDNPFFSFPTFISPAPHFYDHDGDSDQDLLLGDAQGNFKLFLNNTINTSVEELREISATIYPNPTAYHLIIKGIDDALYANVFSMDGKMVLTKPFLNSDLKIDVHDLAEGNYILKVTSDQGIWTTRFIKM